MPPARLTCRTCTHYRRQSVSATLRTHGSCGHVRIPWPVHANTRACPDYQARPGTFAAKEPTHTYRITTCVPVRLTLTVVAPNADAAEAQADVLAKAMQPPAGYLPTTIPTQCTATWPKPRDWDWDLPEVVT